jgi:pyruvate formate lyase activating enzyme
MGHQEKLSAVIFDIQGFSVHDGPGCRTLIFMKGCPLRCSWCSNPEGQLPYPEPLYRHEKCLMDLNCVTACKHQAIRENGNSLVIQKELCRDCAGHECIGSCYSRALELAGYTITLDDLFTKIQRDRPFWGSGGGITLTGGEPFAQHEFTHRFLEKCYNSHIHTAIETCGYIPWQNIEPSLDFLDWIFYDLKHADTKMHQHETGAGNELIFENALKIAHKFTGRLVFRLPLIPAYNDSEEAIAGIASFIKSTGRNEINILPMHHLGSEKYILSGKEDYRWKSRPIPDTESLTRVKDWFEGLGVRCWVGSETPF